MNDILLEDELRISIQKVLNHIRCLDVEKTLITSDRITVISRLQTAFKVQPNNHVERALYELIITHALEAEKMGPGAFKRCIDLLLSEDCLILDKSVNASLPNIDNLHSLIDDISSSQFVSCIVKDAIKLAGFAGRIIVEKTSSSTPSIELVRGYTFNLESLINVDVNLLKPRIVCIDGLIESVSEIHHFLESASEAKEACIMFVRGISDDVKHTLRVNFDRGSLKVIPMSAKFDLTGMNTLVDIATVAGTDIVSSLKGDLISSIKFNELPVVEQVTIYKGRVVITHAKTYNNVSIHVSKLRDRRKLEQIDDIGKLLDARIRSLSPNHVIIRLPDDKEFIIRSQSIDYSLRAVRSAIDNGIIDGRLASTEIAATVYAKRCRQMLSQFGACLCT